MWSGAFIVLLKIQEGQYHALAQKLGKLLSSKRGADMARWESMEEKNKKEL